MNKRQKKKYGMLQSQKWAGKAMELDKEVYVSRRKIIDLDAHVRLLKEKIWRLERCGIQFSVDRCFGGSEPSIGLNIVMHPMEFKLNAMGPYPGNISEFARMKAFEAAEKIQDVLIKFVETGDV
jgi:hypothetical protein